MDNNNIYTNNREREFMTNTRVDTYTMNIDNIVLLFCLLWLLLHLHLLLSTTSVCCVRLNNNLRNTTLIP